MHMPHFGRGNLLWRFDAYFWVPFAWRQDDHLVQKLVDTRNQVVTVSGFVGDVAEKLTEDTEVKSKYQQKWDQAVECVGAASVTYIIHHQRRDGSANLIVGLGFAVRTQQDEEKSTRVAGYSCSQYWDALNIRRNEKRGTQLDAHLVGTGTSVRPPSVVAWAKRTKDTKGFSRKSTSPTRTFDASASRGIFFMNLFFNWQKGEEAERYIRAEVNFLSTYLSINLPIKITTYYMMRDQMTKSSLNHAIIHFSCISTTFQSLPKLSN